MELESVTAATPSCRIGTESDAHLHVKYSICDPIGLANREEVVCVARSTSHGYSVLSLREASDDKRTSFHLQCHQATDLPQSVLDEFLIRQTPEYLRSSAGRKVHVVVSTHSGTGLALGVYKTVLEPLFSTLGFTAVDESSSGPLNGQSPAVAEGRNYYALTVTRDAQSIRDFARGLSESSKHSAGSELEHTVVMLSGDGGIVEMLNGKTSEQDVASTAKTPLVAILPLGTGNALFHSLHKPIYASHGSSQPTALVLGLRTLLKGQPAPLPSFRASFSPGSRSITYTSRPQQDPKSKAEADADVQEQTDAVTHMYGAIVASYGFHAQLVWESDTPEYRWHGDKRFGMVAAELLKQSHAYHATVELAPPDGGPPRVLGRSRYAYVLAAAVSNLEKTFTISPASRPLDGRLRLVHFGAVGGQRTMDVMMRAYDEGSHVGMRWPAEDGGAGEEEAVGYDEVGEVAVTTLEEDARWRKVCVDGTIVELARGGTMRVRTEHVPRLRVLVDAFVVGA